MELADRLPFCPRCSYSFTGLPATHQCPECGLAYDDDSVMSISAPSKRRETDHTRLTAAVIFLAVFVILLTRAFPPQWIVYRLARVVFSLLCLAMGIISLRNWHTYNEPKSRFLALMPDGLWYTSLNERVRMISWKKIKSVSHDWIPTSGHVIFVNLLPKGRVHVPAGFVSSVEIHGTIARIMSRIEKPSH